MITYLKNFTWGIIMALGELLPGVGMQTVAIVGGIYNEMIKFFYDGTEFLKTIGLFILGKAKKDEIAVSFKSMHWGFGLPIFIGLAITIVGLSHTVSGLFETYPSQVAAISFGIVLASVVIPYKEMDNKTWKEFLLFLATFAAFYGLFSIKAGEAATEPGLLLFLGGGLLASFAGFFPGISISFALLIMGLYAPLLASVDHITSRNADLYSFLSLLLFFVGLGIGMLVCVRLLELFMNKYKSLLLAFIVGLILASLRAIWPFANASGDLVMPWQLSLPLFTQQIIFITIAFVLVSLIRKIAEDKGTISSSFGQKERTIIQG